jgi:hypothetical protein
LEAHLYESGVGGERGAGLGVGGAIIGLGELLKGFAYVACVSTIQSCGTVFPHIIGFCFGFRIGGEVINNQKVLQQLYLVESPFASIVK